jgi:antitoxin YefM
MESSAIIMYMATLSVAAARGSFSKIVEAAETNHERFEVTRNGSRVAVLLGADDYDGLLETLAVVSDSEAVEAIRAGLADLESGETFSAAEVRAAMVEAGRLQA